MHGKVLILNDGKMQNLKLRIEVLREMLKILHLFERDL